jgi:hypothetical protein
MQGENEGDGDVPVASDGAGPSSRANDDQRAPQEDAEAMQDVVEGRDEEHCADAEDKTHEV